MEYIEFLDLAQKNIKNTIITGNGFIETYKEYVETFKFEHPDIIEQYGLTESELFVMFMMLIKNFDEIQQCASSGRESQFTKECVRQYDSFLSKIPVSESLILYRVERYYKIHDFERMWKTGQSFDCSYFLTASNSRTIFEKFGDGVKIYINKRRIGNSKAHEVFKVFDGNGEMQVNFERNTRFRIDNVDKINKSVMLTEL